MCPVQTVTHLSGRSAEVSGCRAKPRGTPGGHQERVRVHLDCAYEAICVTLPFGSKAEVNDIGASA